MNPANTTEAIEMPFASRTRVGLEKHVLHIADRLGRILYCVHSTQYSLLVTFYVLYETMNTTYATKILLLLFVLCVVFA